jgi:DNA-binding PadR family transcriptional regulator
MSRYETERSRWRETAVLEYLNTLNKDDFPFGTHDENIRGRTKISSPHLGNTLWKLLKAKRIKIDFVNSGRHKWTQVVSITKKGKTRLEYLLEKQGATPEATKEAPAKPKERTLNHAAFREAAAKEMMKPLAERNMPKLEDFYE